MKQKVLVVGSVIILGFFSLGRATPPLEAPMHRIQVIGTLIKTGANVGGYAVVLIGYLPGDTTVHVLQGRSSTDHDLVTSASDGLFGLTVTTEMKPDSVAVAAFHLDAPAGRTAFFAVEESTAMAIWETYRTGSDQGCGNCVTDITEKERISLYLYTYPSIEVRLP